MNFFEQQQQARTRTALLIVYFAIAVALIVLVVNLAVRALLPLFNLGMEKTAWFSQPYWIYVSGITLLIIGGGSAVRFFQLGDGAESVAQLIGARRLDPSRIAERRLINVVEEMAIASGVPVPQIYSLDNETGINAFVAGLRPSKIVLVVTRGALDQLSREELQGVVGHEFSHILNGDMRLNVRLLGILAGLLAIGQLGRFLLRGTKQGDVRRAAFFFLLGIALYLTGYIGLFFGRLIKAAISRQREYLADASSVQFTRNPSGLAGALYKIGQNEGGPWLDTRFAEDISHMCFAQSVATAMQSLLATHPPIGERIARIDPAYPAKARAKARKEIAAHVQETAPPPWAGEQLQSPAQVIAAIGNPTPQHVAYTAALLGKIPEKLLQAARITEGAKALIYTFLLQQSGHSQLPQLPADDRGALRSAMEYIDIVTPLGVEARLPLIDMSLATVKRLPRAEQDALLSNAHALAQAGGRLNLFGFLLLALLDRQFSEQPARLRERYRSFTPVLADIHLLLSALAHAGNPPAEAPVVYEKIMRRFSPAPPPILGITECRIERLSPALSRLAELTPLLKSPLVNACADCILDDGRVEPAEAELLRAICAVLDVPMPPLLPAAPTGLNFQAVSQARK